MIKGIFITIFCSLLLGSVYAQEPYTPQQMRDDVDSMVKYLEDVHPDAFYRYPKTSFLKDVAQVKAGLTDNLNKVDFFLKIEPLLGRLEDGHTDLHVMGFYNSLNPYMLPYNVKLSTKPPFIVNSGAFAGVIPQLPLGAQIISINNISAQKITNDIIDLNTGENRLFRAEFGATRFHFYPEALYKANGSYRIKYKSKGKINAVTIKGIRRTELEQLKSKQAASTAKSDPIFSTRYFDKDHTALINFKSFDWDGFPEFINATFKELKERNIQNLIINLIDNGGGDSDVGDEFFQFLLDKPFTQYAKVVEKNSEPLKDRLRDHRKGKTFNKGDSALLAKQNGTIDTVYYDVTPVRDNPLRFNGQVIVLVNVETYSSASDFAQCFKYYKRGVVIGQETGGLVKSYGDIVTVNLPNTGLELTVSSKLYYNVGATEADWRGVIPDIYSTPDKALQRALKYIKDKK